MQNPGRAAAAIQILDQILGGEPAEKALTAWGRASRYAGSKDRAAVRDLVYEALRARRSLAALGGAAADEENGRALVLGLIRARGEAVEAWFAGAPHGPAPVRADEAARVAEGAAALDLPDWLEAPLRQDLAADFDAVIAALRQRAPVFLRVNLARASRELAVNMLAAEGIVAKPHPMVKTALEVSEGARKIQNAEAYLSGVVELQDLSSQAVVAALPLADGMRVLDHCAGGGGKTLAMAGLADLDLFAHDFSPRRMEDLKTRATRAGIEVRLTATPEALAPFDLVLTDVPCSGSGSWRRDPAGKWALTPARLEELQQIQAGILERAAKMLRPGGWLAYATCSFLSAENEAQIAAFRAAHPGWTLEKSLRFSPLQGGDGFYLALLQREA
ncbi:RsmB/NOP family class I SAM-dependent RNA methyltransferase [Pseudogemmobacter faecipullorum]|uniref:RsmB/NOP family class I SAM-dependent RNA methyltransferase n=1 Tax=Pseudogemmobacter faecipullorum TaxID=2755041 RepID=A0ABS8CIC0_9RHOB|nr:RsmB/NOP family class I SAM-dependent RNA methyltransferase [Pseudogemmobacter faecipullorum]MCB5409126.1 RsmB/NOP family class I SAM-dependent RNA methyltransferase [Pseudogemmobacter faecipullorum]